MLVSNIALLKLCRRNYKKARREIFASWIAANVILVWKRGTSRSVSKRRALRQSRSRYTFRNSQILSVCRAPLNIISLRAWRSFLARREEILRCRRMSGSHDLCVECVGESVHYICLKITLGRVERNARKCERKTGRYDVKWKLRRR